MPAVDLYLFSVPSDANRNDFRLRDPSSVSGFPVQFDWLRTFYDGAVKTLSVVAVADAPSGMGGQLRIQKGGTAYAVYLVETSDLNASKVRIRTSAGTKSIRLKT